MHRILHFIIILLCLHVIHRFVFSYPFAVSLELGETELRERRKMSPSFRMSELKQADDEDAGGDSA